MGANAEPTVYCSVSSIGGASSGRLIVYLPGMLCPARESIEPLADLWKQHGEVICVDYGTRGQNSSWEIFNPDAIIDTLGRYIDVMVLNGFTDFLIVGASLGGSLAYDLIKSRPSQTFDFVPVCTPFHGASDLHYPLRALAPVRRVLTHRTAARLNQFELMAHLMYPPKDENLEPGVKRGPVDRYASHCGAHRISFYRDQTIYLLSPREITHLPNLRMTVVVGGYKRDDIVTQAAATRAYRELGADVLIQADVGHVAFWEQPTAWNKLFASVFATLGW